MTAPFAAYLLSLLFVRTSARELGVVAVGLLAFFHQPRTEISVPELPRLLSPADVVVVGIDSASFEDIAPVLDEFNPARASALIYDDAYSAVALTSVAWRTVFAGRTPLWTEALPGIEWPRERAEWLPSQLVSHGYSVALLQDDPTTNVFGPTDDVVVPSEQGWKRLVQETAWTALFPLATTGAPWWISLFGGPADSPSRFGYDPDRFWRAALTQLAERSRAERLFFATHSCEGHAPVHLSLSEARRIPGWWALMPWQLEGSGNPFFPEYAGQREVDEIRMASVRDRVGRLLRALERGGVIGGATVILLSDHGPRGHWVPEDRVHHVVLAGFVPGARASRHIAEPVSLADVALTILKVAGIAPRVQGGLPGFVRDAQSCRRTPPQPAPALSQLGFNLHELSESDANGAVEFRKDGSFVLTDAFAARILGGDKTE